MIQKNLDSTGVDSLVEKFMIKYNRAFINLQYCPNVLKNKIKYLEHLLICSKKKLFVPGVKIVRGAYMEKERSRAQKFGYNDPICKINLKQ